MHCAYIISVEARKGAIFMANTTNFSVRMDSDIKKQAEAMYGELGIDLTARYQCISSTDTSG